MDSKRYHPSLNYPSAPNMPGLSNQQSYPGGSMPPLQLAHAYVPWQYMGNIFSPAEGLTHGTIFPELLSPYPGKKRGESNGS